MGNQKRWKTRKCRTWNNVLFNEYAGFKVIYVYVRFMGVPLQFLNKHVFTVILLKVHWADSDLFTRAKHKRVFCMNACERFVCVPSQCLNKTLLYCDNLPTNYTCPPFSGPVSVVLHFQVLHFHVFHLFWSPFSVHPRAVCPDTVGHCPCHLNHSNPLSVRPRCDILANRQNFRH